MKQNIRMNVLGIYELFLSLGAAYIGFLMIISKKGIFNEFPKEWLTKVPFDSLIIPGIIAIIVFGAGNAAAALLSFRKTNKESLHISSLMGCVFFILLIAQVIILGEWYLATIEFLLLSVIQIGLCCYAFLGYRNAITHK